MTVSLRIPHDLAAQMKRYASLHRQSVTELLLDGLKWRTGEGDPHGLGMAAPSHTVHGDNEYDGNTAMSSDVLRETDHTAVLQEIRTALASQAIQLQALAQALAHHAIVPTYHEYSSNTESEAREQLSTPESAREGSGQQTPQDTRKKYSNTVLQKHAPAFDPARFVLGPLCQKQHDYDGQGHSLRQIGGKHECVECKNARSRDYKQRQREAKSA